MNKPELLVIGLVFCVILFLLSRVIPAKTLYLAVVSVIYLLVLYGSGILRKEDIALFSRRKSV